MKGGLIQILYLKDLTLVIIDIIVTFMSWSVHGQIIQQPLIRHIPFCSRFVHRCSSKLHDSVTHFEQDVCVRCCCCYKLHSNWQAQVSLKNRINIRKCISRQLQTHSGTIVHCCVCYHSSSSTVSTPINAIRPRPDSRLTLFNCNTWLFYLTNATIPILT